ncbi:restriction endonuclease subunit S [Faecalibacillus intestinalis]|uniref:restriction endonuclease subunit S n=1 Tax=Faecalibacillus intestinalis TaxID=1982626 RepID=UPI00399BF1D9
MKENKTKPDIRFKGFTEAWEQRKLGGLLFKVGKKNKNNLSLEAYSITNDNGFIPQDEAHDEFGYMKNTDKSAYIIVPPFSFGYNPARINVGSIGYYNGKKNVIVSSLYEVFQTNKALNDQFLWYWLKSDELTKWIEKLQEGSVRLYFYYDKLEQCLISISSVEEQIKIGQYFSQLDNLITLHQRECDQLKELKKSMLKKMFPRDESSIPEVRFAGFTDAWEQRKLGDSCKINGRIGFRGYTEKDIVTKKAGGVLTFSPTNIVDNKLTMECKNTYITREKYDESPEIKISNGDILFVKTGSTLGKSALVTGLKEDASINPQIVVMRVEKNTETFMSNILITNGVMKQVAAVKIGGAVPTMTETELKNFTYFAPAEKEEKKKIGDFFRTLDHLITLHQRELEILKNLKKTCLKRMFI